MKNGAWGRGQRAWGVGARIGFGALALGLPAFFVLPTVRAPEPPPVDEVTYAKNVAPIIQKKCQVCHQPGSIAPMSLLTYDDVRGYAGEIKDRVTAREMPPWHIDKTIGIQAFKNDRSLSDQEIQTIAKWVDAGAPRGDAKDEPPAVKFADPNAWQLEGSFGKPDLVIRTTPYTMAANTQDKWYRPTVETGVTEPRWVRAIEVKPARAESRKVVHHALAYLIQDEP